MEERIQKLIAKAGITSRRKAEELILQGRVKVNGVKATIGQKADPKKDELTVDKRPLHFQKKRYFLLYKPKGYVTTMSDEFHRPCIKDLFEKLQIREKLFTVGRLDYDSEGLMIATNDGELANKIAHPRFGTKKTYNLVLSKPFNDRAQKRLSKGIAIDGKKVEISDLKVSEDPKHIELTIHEGRNRIVRKLMEKIGFNVMVLIRTKIGDIELNGLREGQFKEVSREEIEKGVRINEVIKRTNARSHEKQKSKETEEQISKSKLKRIAERKRRYSA